MFKIKESPPNLEGFLRLCNFYSDATISQVAKSNTLTFEVIDVILSI